MDQDGRDRTLARRPAHGDADLRPLAAHHAKNAAEDECSANGKAPREGLAEDEVCQQDLGDRRDAGDGAGQSGTVVSQASGSGLPPPMETGSHPLAWGIIILPTPYSSQNRPV